MFLKPSITVSEQPPSDRDGRLNPFYPKDLKCRSGHVVSPGIKFYRISGDGLDKAYWGTYCEYCLKLVHMLVERKKKNNSSSIEALVDKELDKAKVNNSEIRQALIHCLDDNSFNH
jgi:hypothetical protein